jgi:hypothetical protein
LAEEERGGSFSFAPLSSWADDSTLHLSSKYHYAPKARRDAVKRFATCSFAALLIVSPAAAQGHSSASGGHPALALAVIALGIPLGLFVYFLPTIVGRKRQISSLGALFFVNLFFGLTGVGWMLCFIWAATGATRAQDAFYVHAAKEAAPPEDDKVYKEAYARERARMDFEAEQRAKGHVP